MAVWDTAYVNDLPDSSFAWIESGGSKDSDGKTTPRSLRHLPYKDASGKPDLPHVRNALARLNQVQGMPDSEKSRVKAMLQRILQQNNDEQPRYYRIEEFAESALVDGLVKIHAFPFKSYTHPDYGEIEFTPDIAQEMKQNFDNNVMEHDIAWNYAHERDVAKGNKASGWARRLEITNDGLFVFVEPTKTARKELEDGEWRYSSVERLPEWTHPHTGEVFHNVLRGGAFTNHPFVKGVAPLNFEEYMIPRKPKEDRVDRAELCKRLGLPEDASDDIINAKIQEFQEKAQKFEDVGKGNGGKPNNGDIQKFEQTEPQLYAEIVAARAFRIEHEAEKFADNVKTDDGKVLAPVHRDKVAEAHKKLTLGEITVQQFAEVLAESTSKGLVKFGETGGSRSPAPKQDDEDNKDMAAKAQQFADESKKYAAEHKVSYMDAMMAVAATEEGQKLAQAYADVPVPVLLGGGE